MAAAQVTPSAMDLASSLTQDEIPIKLRCAICNKLVINAFRLPCCDQSICEPCQSSLPDSCPVCAHSPLSADDCKPNKALRLTVKAFLKSEEKKRDKDRVGSLAVKAETPVTATPAATPVVESIEKPVEALNQQPTSGTPDAALNDAEQRGTTGADDGAAAATSEQGARPSHDDSNQQQPEGATVAEAKQTAEPESANGQADAAAGQDQVDQNGIHKGQQEENENLSAAWGMNGNPAQQHMYGAGFGFGDAQTGYQNMDWTGTGGFNPMMQMQMQNGMQPGSWNGFPNMIGMSGMGMDSMGMSQGMYGGFAGQGMGMNGMNGMNMGMDFGGGYGGWDGQQMSSDFGGAHAGYYPGGGYNQQSHQGHFPHHQMHHQQQFPKSNYQNRFQGQGAHSQRGYGRGPQGNYGVVHGQGQGYGQPQMQAQNQAQGAVTQAPQSDDDAFSYQIPAGLQARRPSQQASVEPSHREDTVEKGAQDQTENTTGEASGQLSTEGETAAGTSATDEKLKGEVKHHEEDTTITQDGASTTANEERDISKTTTAEGIQPNHALQEDTFPGDTSQQLNQIATIDSMDQPNFGGAADPMLMQVPQGSMMPDAAADSFNSMAQQAAPMDGMGMGMMPDLPHRGRGGRRGGFGRGGFENFRGGFGGRGVKGFVPNEGDFTVVTPVEPKGQGVEGAPTGPKAMREGLPNVGFRGRGGFAPGSGRGGLTAVPAADNAHSRPRSKSPERARSRSRSRTRSRSRSRSQSPSRRHRRRHRHRSPSTSTESESRDRRRERRRHRSSRKYDDDEEGLRTDRPDDLEDVQGRVKEPRSREPSVESSRHRSSRRDKERHRSSRSHRDRSRSRSRERRKHRHRSRSPVSESMADGDDTPLPNGTDVLSSVSSLRKSKSEKYRERDHDRERERDRDRDRERDRDRDRDRDHERKRSRRDRDRSTSPHDYSEDDRHHRSSRRTRKEKNRERPRDKERERDRDRPSEQPKSTKLDSSAAASESEFKIQGRSRDRNKPASSAQPQPTSMAPPTGPKAQVVPPKGPAADRKSDRRSDRRPSIDTTTSNPKATPTAPSLDPHTLEREARNRERMLKEQQRRMSLQSSDRKRSYSDATTEEKKPFAPPTGPSAERDGGGRSSRRKVHRASDVSNGVPGGEAGRGKVGRRVSYKYEDEENDEARARRVESEREAARWG